MRVGSLTMESNSAAICCNRCRSTGDASSKVSGKQRWGSGVAGYRLWAPCGATSINRAGCSTMSPTGSSADSVDERTACQLSEAPSRGAASASVAPAAMTSPVRSSITRSSAIAATLATLPTLTTRRMMMLWRRRGPFLWRVLMVRPRMVFNVRGGPTESDATPSVGSVWHPIVGWLWPRNGAESPAGRRDESTGIRRRRGNLEPQLRLTLHIPRLAPQNCSFSPRFSVTLSTSSRSERWPPTRTTTPDSCTTPCPGSCGGNGDGRPQHTQLKLCVGGRTAHHCSSTCSYNFQTRTPGDTLGREKNHGPGRSATLLAGWT